MGGVEHRDLELARELAARGHDGDARRLRTRRAVRPLPGVERLALGPAIRLYDGARAGAERGGAARLRPRDGASRRRRFRRRRDRQPALRAPASARGALPAGRRARCSSPGTSSGAATGASISGRRSGRCTPRSSAPASGWAARRSRTRGWSPTGSPRRRGEAVEVVPVGVRVDAIAAAPPPERGPAAAPLVYAGRLIPDKRIDLLLEAVARLAPRIPGRLLDIVGDGPERSRLEALAGRLGVAGAVRFRGRLAGAAEVWAALGGAQVAVQPSRREGFGIFPLEAMAAGLPVVHCESAESAVGELVEHERHGLGDAPRRRAARRRARPAARRRGRARAFRGGCARARTALRLERGRARLRASPGRAGAAGGGLRAARRSRA